MLSDKAKKLGQEPAFPYTVKEGDEVWSGGCTKRQYFAALAMQGLLANERGNANLDLLPRAVLASVDAILESLAKEDA